MNALVYFHCQYIQGDWDSLGKNKSIVWNEIENERYHVRFRKYFIFMNCLDHKIEKLYCKKWYCDCLLKVGVEHSCKKSQWLQKLQKKTFSLVYYNFFLLEWEIPNTISVTISVLANLWVILVMLMRKRRCKSTHIFILTLAICDILYSSCIHPFLISVSFGADPHELFGIKGNIFIGTRFIITFKY